MSQYEKLALRAMRLLDPERAHRVALTALKSGFAPHYGGPVRSSRLVVRLAGLELQNPIGLAAGFDKNAEAIKPLSKAGFGFLEVGAATPKPQPGNPKPRLFRLTRDRAAINRFGFNNEGVDAIAARLEYHDRSVPIGLNLGANKDSKDKAEDFATVLRHAGEFIDFATVNVSSPNTEKLRDLQGKEALTELLGGVVTVREMQDFMCPIFLKIAPDLSDAEVEDIAEVAAATRIDGIIATNTTLAREGLRSRHRGEAGGLSGQPLFKKSTRVLARLSRLTDLPLIGVGGVATAEHAYKKIKAGASAVQLYTAMVYDGISLGYRIAEGLDKLLERDGFAHVAEAVGIEKDQYT